MASAFKVEVFDSLENTGIRMKQEQANKKKLTWDVPHEVDGLTAAFPATVSGTLLPPMSEIPEEFRTGRNKWCRIAMRLFFSGGTLPQVKEGINAAKAKRHLSAVLGSFEPKHEHKEAGAGWLMSMWYQDPEPAK